MTPEKFASAILSTYAEDRDPVLRARLDAVVVAMSDVAEGADATADEVDDRNQRRCLHRESAWFWEARRLLAEGLAAGGARERFLVAPDGTMEIARARLNSHDTVVVAPGDERRVFAVGADTALFEDGTHWALPERIRVRVRPPK